MGGKLLTDKLVFRWLEVLGVWSLDSATPFPSAYPVHASGSPETKKAYFMTTEGPRHPTLIQILAHELGHVVTGAKDDGPDQMNNTNRNENPIMKELGAPERTAYPPVDIEAWLRDILGKFRWR